MKYYTVLFVFFGLISAGQCAQQDAQKKDEAKTQDAQSISIVDSSATTQPREINSELEDLQAEINGG